MQFLKQFAEKTKKWKVAVTVMAAIVVFITTYALILPAITLDEDTAEKQGGIELRENAAPADEDMDVAEEPEPAAGEDAATDEDFYGDVLQAATISDSGKTYNIEVAYGDRAGIPEDAQLKVEEIDEASDEYEDYIARTEELIGKGRTVDFARFFDIRIMADNTEIQPADDVDVRIEMADKLKKEYVTAIHFGTAENDKDEVEDTVLDAEVEKAESKKMESAVSFGTDGFSVYGVVSTTIEKEVLTSDGHKYKITVTCGEDAGVPEEADLEVSEITDYDQYMFRIGEALGWEEGTAASYIRLFDIKIVDENGDKVTIQAPVDVKIELSDKDDSKKAEENTQVVHFADEADNGEIVQDVSVEGTIISFSADGFSEYAIVEGPDPAAVGWHKLDTLDDLTSRGYYLGNPEGFYFKKNTITTSDGRIGIEKTKPAQSSPPTDKAVEYYFEAAPNNKYYVYCNDGSTKKYLYNNGNNSLSFASSESDKTAFNIKIDNGYFKIYNGSWYVNMQGGTNGSRFCCWNSANDKNNNLNLWYFDEVTSDPYELDGKSYGLMNWNGGQAGKAMMAEEQNGALKASQLTVMSKLNDDTNAGKLFVPKDSDISMWTFHWHDNDNYYVTADIGGSTGYLKIDSSGDLSLVYDESEASSIQVIPGTGVHKGQICLKANGKTLTYSGDINTGFNTSGDIGNEWLYLTNKSELTEEYFMTHSAKKISVSDPALNNESKLIVYTRAWNEDTKKYEFFAINHDGTLVQCTENGDSIEWVGGLLNTMLWDFTEYKENGEATGYYELFNEYSEKYIAPQVTGGQILAEDKIGINLPGRTNGKYCTSILAWDDDNYTYAGLKVENGQIVSCPKSGVMDFYFATVEEIEPDDSLHTVPTVDHTQYGITMKIKDFDTGDEMSAFLGSYAGGAVTTTVPNLLSSRLGEDGYPTTNPDQYPGAHDGSLKDLFEGGNEVNHLFIESTYKASGYYEFDSTQNFASLKGNTGGDFTVYKELGTHDTTSKPSLKHGQFYPFNDIQAGNFAVKNGRNLYTATLDLLPSNDPRRNEQLYLLENPDYFYGVELEASFIQTPSGLDAWGHDIIYEFTGDDDFWLYVNDELVIDLGGIHSALPGSVNFRTGEVNVNGKKTSLRKLFTDNYINRYEAAHGGAQPPQDEVDAFLNGYFDEDNPDIFKTYSTNTMRIFYMERGASAANLHMRFNLASIKPGTVELSKKLSGVDTSETILAEFPYQVRYHIKNLSTGDVSEEKYVKNIKAPSATVYPVVYKDTVTAVPYYPELEVSGITYEHVLMLKPDETAVIDFTELEDLQDNEIIEYEVLECGVNTGVYEKVSANDIEIQQTDPEKGTIVNDHGNHKDYGLSHKPTNERASVMFDNTVNPNALRTLTFDKKLFEPDGETSIPGTEDNTLFKFRLYLGTEYDNTPALANMHSYHVKDPDGNYCVWNATDNKFVSLGITDYSELTAEQKAAATFTTSMNGTISKIPVDYTVEVRELLAGTKFRVQERPWEIPDGYSFQKYRYTDNYGVDDPEDYKSGGHLVDAVTGVTDVTVLQQDPHVDVCNIKGWGLRVNKTWSDQDYMSGREATYFAVFTRKSEGGTEILTPVNGTVRQMAYSDDASTQTEYWYFLTLPDTSVAFDDYVIREVTLSGEHLNVDENGVVTNYETLDPIDPGEELTLAGRQKGESGDSDFTYSVLYEKGEISPNSNVRVDTTTNNRPGVVLKKTDWNGNALEGAKFTLTRGEDEIGTFTSDENGLITVAFLSDDVEYTLTETETPQTYHGLEAPMNLKLKNGSVTVSGVDEAWYSIGHTGKTPTVTIKNRPYTFQVVKIDRNSHDPLQGVKFELYQKKIVGGQTSFVPMTGYEELITNEDGILPKIDNTLPPGTYQLRELEALDNYETLPDHIYFTVTQTGMITLDDHPDGVTLKDDPAQDGSIPYELEIENVQLKSLRFKKVDIASPDSSALEGAVFDMYRVDEEGQVVETLYTGLISNTEGFLEHREPGYTDDTIFKLGIGRYQLVETQAPEGYNQKENPVTIIISRTNGAFEVTYDDPLATSAVTPGTDGIYLLKISNSSGLELPSTGGNGTTIFYILGAILMALAAAGLVFTRRRGIRC